MPRRCALLLAVLALLAPLSRAGLSPAERAAGWRSIFDGETFNGWRGYRADGPPAKGWAIEDGALHVIAGGGGGDIITTEQFGDFELALEFRVAPLANSGIMYRVAEIHGAPWMTGPEFQVLDDARDEALDPRHAVAAVYDLYRPAVNKPVKPAGRWNLDRIRVRDGIVQHYLNGMKVAEYDMRSKDWTDRIAGSKFRVYEGFGVQPRGHICLQDHGDDVWYRNIRIREFDKPAPGEIVLFNGNDLTGWTTRPRRGADPDAWSVRNRAIVGTPGGMLASERNYENFVLTFRWRSQQTPDADQSLLIRLGGEQTDRLAGVEIRLEPDNAGEIRNRTDAPLTITTPPRGSGMHTVPTSPDAWNHGEVIADGNRVTVFINGEKTAEATGCPAQPGAIALRCGSGGFRITEIRLTPIE
ncbi:MAG TPA: DUF1080 domain-containing protein [Phycisphaerales bacterium]|nr:DUF1080 domain-containing protein [Phycisphaerales bacterium]